MFKTKYPLWSIKGCDKPRYNKVKDHYGFSSSEFDTFAKKITLLNKAFERIKVITSLELLRLELDTVLFPCWNSWFGTSLPKGINKTIVFQNRETRTIEKEITEVNFQQMENTEFLYETPFQQLNIKNELKYNLKLYPDFYIEKQLFQVLDGKPTEKIIAGKPNVNTSFDDLQKPSLFVNVKNRLFLNTRKIEYYQNFNRFEENSRIIPEARYFGIKIEVIKDHSGFDINNLPYNAGIGEAKYDSSVTRLKNNLNDYILSSDDYVIKLLKDH